MCRPISSPYGCGILLSDFIVIFFLKMLKSGYLFGDTYEPKIGFHKLSLTRKMSLRLGYYYYELDVALELCKIDVLYILLDPHIDEDPDDAEDVPLF